MVRKASMAKPVVPTSASARTTCRDRLSVFTSCARIEGATKISMMRKCRV
jgi:hypothetical protein